MSDIIIHEKIVHEKHKNSPPQQTVFSRPFGAFWVPLCAGSVKIFDEFRHWRIENFYPFTPPWMTPFSILSWKKGKAMMMGAMAAMITANWIRYRL